MKVRGSRFKERLAIGLSVAAFALSLFSFYVTGLRVTDDLRVVAGEMPFLVPNFSKKEFTLEDFGSSFTFMNVGTRSAVITGVILKVAQPEEHLNLQDSGCGVRARKFRYDIDPFVLKSGDMLTKGLAKMSGVVPFSDLNAQSKKVKFKLCVDVAFTTPSVEYNVVTINEFEDELDDRVMGYAFTGSGKTVERRPVQLIKRTGILLFD